MNLTKKQIAILILLVSLAGFFVFNNNDFNFTFFKKGTVKATSHCGSHNVSGWAWANTPQSPPGGNPPTSPDQGVGWISFNCANQNIGADYGVDINSTTGLLSGYAWAETIGWITFNPGEFGSGCPDTDGICEQANVSTTGSFPRTINGWAKVLSLQNTSDGWIHLSNNSISHPYSTTIDQFGNINGWAWGSDVIGWISFSCNNQGVCGSSNYQTFTAALSTTPTNLSTSLGLTPDQTDYCQETLVLGGQDAITFSWTSGGLDFELQVDTNNNNNYGDAGDYTWAGTSTSITDNRVNIIPSAFAGYTNLSPLTYNWRVRADGGTWVSSTFTLSSHDWPFVNFFWAPLFPAINTATNFTDSSTCYDGGVNHLCAPATGETFSWVFSGGNPASSSTENPSNVTFNSIGSKTVTLSVDDGDGHICTASKTVEVGLTIPSWKEISP